MIFFSKNKNFFDYFFVQKTAAYFFKICFFVHLNDESDKKEENSYGKILTRSIGKITKLKLLTRKFCFQPEISTSLLFVENQYDSLSLVLFSLN